MIDTQTFRFGMILIAIHIIVLITIAIMYPVEFVLSTIFIVANLFNWSY